MSTDPDEPRQLPRLAPLRLPGERPGAAGGKRHQNRLRRVREIGRAALDAFLERGLESVSVDEIVAAAGVAKGSFYRYFSGKPELVERLLQPIVTAIEAAFTRCERDLGAATGRSALFAAYERLALGLTGELLANRDVVRLYLQERRGPPTASRRPVRDLAETVREKTIALTVAAIDRGLLEPLPPDVTAVMVMGAVEALLLDVLEGATAAAPAEIVRTVIAVVLEGTRRK